LHRRPEGEPRGGDNFLANHFGGVGVVAFVVIWLICAFACAIIAGAKHRSVVGWFFLGLILGIIGLIIILVLGDGRPQTVVIQNVVSAQAAAAAPTRERRTSDDDDEDDPPRSRRRAAALPAPPKRSYTELQPAVIALRALATAGAAGLDADATDAILTYLEEESGTDFGRREAQRIAMWAQGLPDDESTIKKAMRELPATISARRAFSRAMDAITSDVEPTALQARWETIIRKQAGI